jgi:hypothetical protein
MLAVDGKRLRGSAPAGHQVHLLAALDHHDGAMLAQRDGSADTNEIALLGHCWPASTLPVWSSPPMRRTPNATTPAFSSTAAPTTCWPSRPTSEPCTPSSPGCRGGRSGHGPHPRARPRPHRDPDPEGRGRRRPVLPPHAAQAIQVTRRVRAPGSRRWRAVTGCAVTSLTLGSASPAAGRLAARALADREPAAPVRDMTCGEDASTARTGSPPRVMASLRNPWPSARCAWPATPTSPQRCDIPAATRPGRS